MEQRARAQELQRHQTQEQQRAARLAQERNEIAMNLLQQYPNLEYHSIVEILQAVNYDLAQAKQIFD